MDVADSNLRDLLPRPPSGRRFSRPRTVRLGDVDRDGFLRLDATARYAQDLANDDSIDGGLSEAAAMAWVVRKTIIERHRPAELRESIESTTWCSGVGSRWAQRRTTLAGARGALIEVATVWVHVDPTTGAPAKLPAEFDALYAEAAQGRKISSRLSHPADVAPDADHHTWPVRVVDLDVLGHVNNAATWAIVEEFGRSLLDDGQPVRAEVEYRTEIPASGPVSVARAVSTGEPGPATLDLWVHAGDRLCATVHARRLNPTRG